MLEVKNDFHVRYECENENISQGRSYENKNISIAHCFFIRSLKYSGDNGYGGIIYVNGGSYNMNVNVSMFYNCSCSERGGAIFFSSQNICLRMICAKRCSCGTTSHGHFAYLYSTQLNQVEFLSVSCCSHTASGYYPVYLYKGIQRVDNSNNSMNQAYQYSGICFYSPISLSSSYNTFSNNNVSQNICLWFFSDSGTIVLSFSNIIHNNSPNGNAVVYLSGVGTRMMNYCIFQDNQDTLFYVNAGSLEVSNSFIDHSSSFSTRTSVSTSSNNTFTIRLSYQLQFFNSFYCNADFPLMDKTPDKTIEKSPMMSFLNTLCKTNQNTQDPTKSLNPTNTILQSPMRTLELPTPRMSLMRTLDQSYRESFRETIPRTYSKIICSPQMQKVREISIIYSFLVTYIEM